MTTLTNQAVEAAVLEALPNFQRQDDYLLSGGASIMSDNCHEIIHVDTLRKIIAAARAELARPLEVAPVESDPSYGDLLTALAECRDTFPAPGSGEPLEHEWAEAIGYPLSVPSYVKLAVQRMAAVPSGNWSIDTSTGKSILMYENCSVIEGDQAQQVLNAIAASRVPVASVAVAYVPVHPRNGPLWMDSFPAGDDVSERRSNSYPLMALYSTPVPGGAGGDVNQEYADHLAVAETKGVQS